MLHLRQTIQFDNDECGVDGSAVRTWCCFFFCLSLIFPARWHALFLCLFPCNRFVQSQMFFACVDVARDLLFLQFVNVCLTYTDIALPYVRMISLYIHETVAWLCSAESAKCPSFSLHIVRHGGVNSVQGTCLESSTIRFIYPSMHSRPPIRPSIHPYIHPSIHPSIHLAMYHFIYLHLSI